MAARWRVGIAMVLCVLAAACAQASDAERAQRLGDWDGGADAPATATGSGATGTTDPPQAVPDTPIRNPVIAADFPDPFVRSEGGTYYAYATNAGGQNIQLRTSTDLATWTIHDDVLPQLPTWAAPGRTWAPSVFRFGDTYVLYFAGAEEGSEIECIGTATSSSPTGPFSNHGTSPMFCQAELGGAIDPDVRRFDGQHWMVWKSDGDSEGQVTAIWSQPLTDDGLSMEPGSSPTQLLTPTEPWQGDLIEAPEMHLGGDILFLVYSANWYDTDRYAVGYAVCESLSGPCTNRSTSPLLASSDVAAGPGGQTGFLDEDAEIWLAYHAWEPGRVGDAPGAARSMRLTRVDAEGDTLTTDGATASVDRG